ncbi:hypothetical protein HETIRDRAFT_453046 [Heterobasidion irregulare TC 32-1]|uniref:Uncharacterized protein n=1 Tax=Heterobasidion irregulare (strain TC 32-1) TaxID=747525 RepID=W4K2U3_HETIT|nr:uncharacterized protein HETIRDRAFT_453046 [Heterobasidion irregulare TC 32-1]ETW80054.1 hypothetical protein HETIRDRAFT_453046 [Heterobasidion irregulare TC 32-1]
MSTPAFHQAGFSQLIFRKRLFVPDYASSSTPVNEVDPLGKFGAFELATSRAPLRPVHHRVLRAQAVTQMLRLLALDLSTATSAEMDGLRPRFVCEPCDAEIQRWTDCASPLTDKDFMTWRTCVRVPPPPPSRPLSRLPPITHALQQHGKPKAPRLALRSLTDEERVYCEMRKQGPHWGCARCTYHVSKSGSAGSWLYRDEIVQHVQSA